MEVQIEQMRMLRDYADNSIPPPSKADLAE
jgi:hypothetical protein